MESIWNTNTSKWVLKFMKMTIEKNIYNYYHYFVKNGAIEAAVDVRGCVLWLSF